MSDAEVGVRLARVPRIVVDEDPLGGGRERLCQCEAVEQ